MTRIPARVETARLVGERPDPQVHAGPLDAVLAEADVRRWIGPVSGLAERDAAAWERDGWGPWVVRDRATGAVIGRAGLAWTTIEGERAVELAWLLGRAWWGRGLASEIAREAVRAAFEDLALEEVIAVTLVDNTASRGVMARLGMAIEREVEHAGLPHVLARLRRPS